MPGPIQYVPVLRKTTLGRGGLSRGIFDDEKTELADYDILITEDGFDLTDETTEATLEP